MSDDNLLSTGIVQIQHAELATWSDDKKNQFAATFKDRVMVARYLLELTASRLLTAALHRHFIGERHAYSIEGYRNSWPRPIDFVDTSGMTKEQLEQLRWNSPRMIGGRTLEDLGTIADERSKTILDMLPPVQKAVQIIDPETAKMMDRIEELKAKGDKLKDELEEASEPIFMAELDQKMTIGDFRQLVKERDKKRRKLLEAMNDCGKQGCELESCVNKRLFKGLPGLAESVMDVVNQHIERSKALDTTARRVTEQVLFGDSEAALELLKRFEADEVRVSDSVHKGFAEALEKLKLAVKKGRVTAKTLRGKA